MSYGYADISLKFESRIGEEIWFQAGLDVFFDEGPTEDSRIMSYEVRIDEVRWFKFKQYSEAFGDWQDLVGVEINTDHFKSETLMHYLLTSFVSFCDLPGVLDSIDEQICQTFSEYNQKEWDDV